MRLNSQNSQRVHTATQKPPLASIVNPTAGKTMTNFGMMDSLLRTKTANFNDSEMRKTKHLVDKISGKFNIDKRYVNQSKNDEERQDEELERPSTTTIHYP